MSSLPDPVRLVIFDLDGVVYRGDEPIVAAVRLVDRLQGSNVLVRFATNNSMVTREAYVERLAAMGIRAGREEIVTSTSATVDHLRRDAPEVRRVLAVGERGIADELRSAGYLVTPAADALPDAYDGGPLSDAYDAVVVGIDRAFDYTRLAAASAAIRAGARFIATNTDGRYPTRGGFLPGAGSMVEAVRVASGVTPLVIGKPEPAMFRSILESSGVAAADALVIGDNPDADIVAARRAGIASVLVLTGVANAAIAAQLEGERRPDLVVRDADELAALLRPSRV